jgi:hypothetical protein
MKDYYAILGVREGAGTAEIKRAYRMLALRYHPDKNPSPEAEALFKEIAEAYDVLGDPEKKMRFDHGRNPFRGAAVEEQYQQQPVEDDNPRYRRRRPSHFRPAPPKPTFKDLILEYHPKLIWINVVAIVFIILLAVDYFLPLKQRVEHILIKSTKYYFHGARYYDHDVLEMSHGERLKLYDHIADNFEPDTDVEIGRTPVFGTIRSISKGANKFTIHFHGIYGPIGIVPLIMLVTAILALRYKRDVEDSYNFTIVSATLLFISVGLAFVL